VQWLWSQYSAKRNWKRGHPYTPKRVCVEGRIPVMFFLPWGLNFGPKLDPDIVCSTTGRQNLNFFSQRTGKRGIWKMEIWEDPLKPT